MLLVVYDRKAEIQDGYHWQRRKDTKQEMSAASFCMSLEKENRSYIS